MDRLHHTVCDVHAGVCCDAVPSPLTVSGNPKLGVLGRAKHGDVYAEPGRRGRQVEAAHGRGRVMQKAGKVAG